MVIAMGAFDALFEPHDNLMRGMFRLITITIITVTIIFSIIVSSLEVGVMRLRRVMQLDQDPPVKKVPEPGLRLRPAWSSPPSPVDSHLQSSAIPPLPPLTPRFLLLSLQTAGLGDLCCSTIL